jgi:integrase
MVSLGVKGEENRTEAVRQWHRLMAGGGEPITGIPIVAPVRVETPVQKEPTPEGLTVRALVDGFLQDAEARIGPESFRGYCKFLTPFVQAHGQREAQTITPTESETFSRKPEWSDTYRAGFLGTLMTAYRWAVRQGLLVSSPLEHIRKPTRKSRGASAVVSKMEHKKLTSVADPMFRDFLKVLWESGARPGEVGGLTAEQVRASVDGVIPLENHKTAHKGKARYIILTPVAFNILKRRAKAAGSGLLFKGQSGPMTPKAVCSKMARLCRKAGIRRLMAYGYRHTFATDALANGVPDATVAALLGHSDTSMLHRHYGHLTSRTAMLREAAKMVR